MVNLGPLAAEIGPVGWGTLANFSGFRVLAALLHGTAVVGVNQALWRRTVGAIYIRQGGHHVGHWPHSSINVKCEYDIRRINMSCTTITVCLQYPVTRNITTEAWYHSSLADFVYTVSKKQATTILSITSRNVDRFSNFFHQHIRW